MKCMLTFMRTLDVPTNPWPWRSSALVGGVAWLLWAVATRPEWTVVLLLASPFVLVPLGLRLAGSGHVGPEAPVLHQLSRLAPLPALAAAAAFVVEPGAVAATLSVPWLGFTLAVAMVGGGRVLSRRWLLEPGIGTDTGLLFLAVGGGWLTISRAGLNPLGFSDAIVVLTAVHFHYAGFALPIVAGVTSQRLHRSALVPLAVIVGVPLTAIGITVGGLLEWLAATMMAGAGMATAFLLLLLGARSGGGARGLLWLSGSALGAGMALALGWAWSLRFGWTYLGLDSMAATHGSLNAIGFGLLGLIGLNLLPTPVPTTGPTGGPRVGLHLGRPSAHTLASLAQRAADHETSNPVGLLRRPTPPGFGRKTWSRRVEHGDFTSAVEAMQRWAGHNAAGIARYPTTPAIVSDQTLALAIPVGPIAVTATCRVIEVVDTPDRYGFTYATLPHHPQDGEESFIVARAPDGTIDVTVTAVWRPATLASRVCPPLTRFLQDRAINRYLDGITSRTEQPRTVGA